jgi:eukaryotic-like serine/threonine-protein kinase
MSRALNTELHFRHTWVLGEQIDGGGFAQVYAAKSAEYESAVAKLIPKLPGAKREQLLADDLTGARNVIPVIDNGETEDDLVLVMHRAEKSLRRYLIEAAGPLAATEVVAILADIVTALADLEGRVVHRDLKPENILLWNGHWCLADFGISRYAEATTAPDTRKYSMTWEYAAPEQWRHERATSATDMYAVGIIAYELLSGGRPFGGPEEHDFRQQHLRDKPAPLGDVPPALGAIIDVCLYKAQEARPSPGKVLALLSQAAQVPPSAGLARLQKANRSNVARLGETGRQASAERLEAERREALADAAIQSLKRISAEVEQAILQGAPSASRSVGLDVGWTIPFNRVELRLAPPYTAPLNPWGSRTAPVFEVIAFSSLSLNIPPEHDHYEGRSHSLWYCDAQEAGRYQWFETAFMIPALASGRSRQEPFAMDPGEESAQAITQPWHTRAQVAWPFTPVDVGGLEEFIDRWAGWLADAAEGRLRRPNPMPERSPLGSWRQS